MVTLMSMEAGFQSRLGFGHDPAPVTPHNALFATYKTIMLLGAAAGWPRAASAQQQAEPVAPNEQYRTRPNE
jgi:hypothetical protein